MWVITLFSATFVLWLILNVLIKSLHEDLGKDLESWTYIILTKFSIHTSNTIWCSRRSRWANPWRLKIKLEFDCMLEHLEHKSRFICGPT